MFIEINRRRRWRRRVNVFNVCLFPGSAPPDKPWRGSPTPSSPGQSHTHTHTVYSFNLSTSSLVSLTHSLFSAKICWYNICTYNMSSTRLHSKHEQFNVASTWVRKLLTQNLLASFVLCQIKKCLSAVCCKEGVWWEHETCCCGSVSLWFCLSVVLWFCDVSFTNSWLFLSSVFWAVGSRLWRMKLELWVHTPGLTFTSVLTLWYWLRVPPLSP